MILADEYLPETFWVSQEKMKKMKILLILHCVMPWLLPKSSQP
jgi:hypothetical protein